jgi:hypothetical protein
MGDSAIRDRSASRCKVSALRFFAGNSNERSHGAAITMLGAKDDNTMGGKGASNV